MKKVSRSKKQVSSSKYHVSSFKSLLHYLKSCVSNPKSRILILSMALITFIIVAALLFQNEKNIFGKAGESGSVLQHGTIEITLPNYVTSQNIGIDFSEGTYGSEIVDADIMVKITTSNQYGYLSLKYELFAENEMLAQVDSPSIEGILQVPSSEENVYTSTYSPTYSGYTNSEESVHVLKTKEGNWVRFRRSARDNTLMTITYDYLPSNTGIFDESVPIENCGILSEPKVYLLTKDIQSEKDCFKITSDDVTIDGGGHTITGSGSPSMDETTPINDYYGVSTRISNDGAYVSRSTIKNMQVKNFARGIQVASKSLVKNVTVETPYYVEPARYGVELGGSAKLVNSSIIHHGGYGVIGEHFGTFTYQNSEGLRVEKSNIYSTVSEAPWSYSAYNIDMINESNIIDDAPGGFGAYSHSSRYKNILSTNITRNGDGGCGIKNVLVFENSYVLTTGKNSHGICAQDSPISISKSNITTKGEQSYAVLSNTSSYTAYIQNPGHVTIYDSTLTTEGKESYGLWHAGTRTTYVRRDNITTKGELSPALFFGNVTPATYNNPQKLTEKKTGELTLEDSIIISQSEQSPAIILSNGTANIANTKISSPYQETIRVVNSIGTIQNITVEEGNIFFDSSQGTGSLTFWKSFTFSEIGGVQIHPPVEYTEEGETRSIPSLLLAYSGTEVVSDSNAYKDTADQKLKITLPLPQLFIDSKSSQFLGPYTLKLYTYPYEEKASQVFDVATPEFLSDILPLFDALKPETKPPSVTILQPLQPENFFSYYDSNFDISIQSEDESGVSKVYYRLESEIFNSEWKELQKKDATTWTGIADVQGIPDGRYYKLQIKSVDSYDNEKIETMINTNIVLDTINPEVKNINPSIEQIHYPPAPFYFTQLRFTMSDKNLNEISLFMDDALVETKKIGSTSEEQEGFFSLPFSNAPEGETHTWYVIIKDKTGHEKRTETGTIIVDKSTPIITMIAPSETELSNRKGITTLFNIITEIADTGTVSEVTGTYSYDHTFSKPLTFTFENEQWKSQTFSPPKDGHYDITIKAKDIAGHETENSYNIFIDSAPPKFLYTTTDYGPADNSYITTREFTVSIPYEESNPSECRLIVNGALLSTSTPKDEKCTIAMFPRPDGTYTWHAEIIDKGGNKAITTERTITIDTSKPTIENFMADGYDNDILDRLIKPLRSDTPITLRATIKDSNSGIQKVSIENNVLTKETNNYAITTTPKDSGCTKEGMCTITLTAIDTAGNKEEKTIKMFIDDTAPTITITEPLTIPSLKSSDKIRFKISSNDKIILASYNQIYTGVSEVSITGTKKIILGEMSLAGIPYYTRQTTPTEIGCEEGTCTLTITSTDIAGNKQDATTNIIVDDTPPLITQTVLAETVSRKSTSDITIPITVKDDSTSIKTVTLSKGSITKNFDHQTGDSYTITTNPAIFGCGEGTCILTITATDTLGNTATSTYTVTIDDTSPKIENVQPEDNTFKNVPVPTFSATIIDAHQLTSYKLYVDGTAFNPSGQTGTTYTFKPEALSEGEHKWYITSTDEAGNVRQTEERKIIIDTRSPDVVITRPGPEKIITKDPQAKLEATVRDNNIASYEFFIDGASIEKNSAPTTSPINPTITRTLPDGTHTAYITATDKAGNTVTSDTKTIIVDTTAPSIQIQNIEDHAIIKSTKNTFVANVIDANIRKVTFYIDDLSIGSGYSNTPDQYQITTTLLTGEHILYVEAFDEAGNSARTEKRTFTIPSETITGIITPVRVTEVSQDIEFSKNCLFSLFSCEYTTPLTTLKCPSGTFAESYATEEIKREIFEEPVISISLAKISVTWKYTGKADDHSSIMHIKAHLTVQCASKNEIQFTIPEETNQQKVTEEFSYQYTCIDCKKEITKTLTCQEKYLLKDAQDTIITSSPLEEHTIDKKEKTATWKYTGEQGSININVQNNIICEKEKDETYIPSGNYKILPESKEKELRTMKGKEIIVRGTLIQSPQKEIQVSEIVQ